MWRKENKNDKVHSALQTILEQQQKQVEKKVINVTQTKENLVREGAERNKNVMFFQ